MAGTRLPNEKYTVGWFCSSTPFYLEHSRMLLGENHYESGEDEETISAHGVHKYILGIMGGYGVVIFFLSPDAEGCETLAMKARYKMMSDFAMIRFSFTIGLASCCSLGVRSQWETNRTKIGDVMICSYGVYRYRDEECFVTNHDVTKPPKLMQRASRTIRSIHNNFKEILNATINYKDTPIPYFNTNMPAISHGKVVTNTPDRYGDLSVGRVEYHENLGNVFYPEPGTEVLAMCTPSIVIRGIADVDPDCSRLERHEYYAALTSFLIAKLFLSHIQHGEELGD